jgi:hypothetical protein
MAARTELHGGQRIQVFLTDELGDQEPLGVLDDV